MPELPEVEVVRRGLAAAVLDRQISSVEVHHDRSVRRHVGGRTDFAAALINSRFVDAVRRGKYMWLSLDDGERALLAHLGMSGQFRLSNEPSTHLRATVTFDDGGTPLQFIDQRTFGHLALDRLVDSDRIPMLVAGIARDPLDPQFDDKTWSRRLRARRTGVKRALLDQGLASGIGNIYADEALWRTRLHWATPTDRLSASRARQLLSEVRAVFADALAAGGTSFDALYVNVNGESGYFSRSLAVYGRQGEPCPRCGRPIRREHFMNRSSYRCPRCQRTPRDPRW